MWPLDLDDRDLLQEFGLRAFSMHACSRNSLKCRIPEVRDLRARGLLIWMTQIYFGSSGFGHFQCMALTIL
jgi:hypothetical protein